VGEGLYLGNTPMYSGVQFVNGYSSFGPRGLEEVFQFTLHGCLVPEGAERILTAEAGPHGLLELFGVDGLVVADRFEAFRPALTAHGWYEIAKVDGGTVFHRTGPPSARVRAVATAEVVHGRREAVQRLRHREAGTPVPLLLLDETESARPGALAFGTAETTLVEDGRHRAVVEISGASGDGDILVVFT